MAQLRRMACRCYQAEDFTFAIHKIEKEVECGLIAVRPEKHILADLGIKLTVLIEHVSCKTLLSSFSKSVVISLIYRNQESNFKASSYI